MNESKLLKAHLINRTRSVVSVRWKRKDDREARA